MIPHPSQRAGARRHKSMFYQGRDRTSRVEKPSGQTDSESGRGDCGPQDRSRGFQGPTGHRRGGGNQLQHHEQGEGRVIAVRGVKDGSPPMGPAAIPSVLGYQQHPRENRCWGATEALGRARPNAPLLPNTVIHQIERKQRAPDGRTRRSASLPPRLLGACSCCCRRPSCRSCI